MDSNGFSDPYVKLHLIPGARKSTKLRTSTVYRCLNPVWNERLVYYGITDEDIARKMLRLAVYDEDKIGADFLGETRVPLKRLTPNEEKCFNVYLEKQMPVDKDQDSISERGKILLSLLYDIQSKTLHVTVVRCAELIGLDTSGYSDPYVKVILLPDSGSSKFRYRTKAKKRTLNPEFNTVFKFPFSQEDFYRKCLNFEVWDKDVGKHDDFIGSVQLSFAAKGDGLRQWSDCAKNPNTVFQHWHKLTVEQRKSSSQAV
ncbi:unnamed protein product [Soboliphyme baturini]|uniref:C2 domain-containing protein n=1 Tax=Soboliphyme baturini TaxID=241478 RepID=A0A183IFT2_9BILA|nr:unnamed protein product [Soboliphyme baturini]